MKGARASLLVAVALLVGAAPAWSEPLTVTGLRLERSGGSWQASVEWRGSWNREPFREVHQGVPIDFTVELELFRERGWWFDASLGVTRVRREVYFNRLTRQYRVIDWASEQRQFTRQWQRAREQVQQTGPVPLVASDRLRPEADYYVGARVRARREQLSLPARIFASFTHLWEGASPWRYQPLEP